MSTAQDGNCSICSRAWKDCKDREGHARRRIMEPEWECPKDANRLFSSRESLYHHIWLDHKSERKILMPLIDQLHKERMELNDARGAYLALPLATRQAIGPLGPDNPLLFHVPGQADFLHTVSATDRDIARNFVIVRARSAVPPLTDNRFFTPLAYHPPNHEAGVGLVKNENGNVRYGSEARAETKRRVLIPKGHFETTLLIRCMISPSSSSSSVHNTISPTIQTMNQENTFPFACPICQFICHTFASSQDHLRTHGPTTPEAAQPARFVCPLARCNRKCRTSKGVQNHMLTHGPKTWKCPSCEDYKVAVRGTLFGHIRVNHSAEIYTFIRMADEEHRLWELEQERQEAARRSQEERHRESLSAGEYEDPIFGEVLRKIDDAEDEGLFS
ncbi:hypothetical protein BDV97DRAFT_409940 [Delphinella strobiligena]|nr:hypothetical protein BDV97DRAFT_409940 [Delphinella strobiligena]